MWGDLMVIAEKMQSVVAGISPHGLIRFGTIQQAQDCWANYEGAKMTVLYENPFGPPSLQMNGLDCVRLVSVSANFLVIR